MTHRDAAYMIWVGIAYDIYKTISHSKEAVLKDQCSLFTTNGSCSAKSKIMTMTKSNKLDNSNAARFCLATITK